MTAFLYNGLAARPFWNASILAPRFLASAFCSGPAFMIILFQVIRKYTRIEIKNEAIFKVAEFIAYSMFINLFLLGAEVFKEYYSDTVHLAPLQYLLLGLKGHTDLVPYIWTAMIFNVTAFFLFLVPQTRENYVTLNIGCVLIFIGVYIEKGMGLVIPGLVPDVLGEIYEYAPTGIEFLVTLGIWATGLLVYTLLLRVAVPILTGEFLVGEDGVKPVIVDRCFHPERWPSRKRISILPDLRTRSSVFVPVVTVFAGTPVHPSIEPRSFPATELLGSPWPLPWQRCDSTIPPRTGWY